MQISLLDKVKHLGEEKPVANKCFSIYPRQLAFAYEKDPNELKTLSSRELIKRLYVVRRPDEGRIVFYYHREALQDSLLEKELAQNGKSKKGESKLNFIIPERKLRLSKGVFLEHMLYEGVHFTLSMDGEVEWLND